MHPVAQDFHAASRLGEYVPFSRAPSTRRRITPLKAPSFTGLMSTPGWLPSPKLAEYLAARPLTVPVIWPYSRLTGEVTHSSAALGWPAGWLVQLAQKPSSSDGCKYLILMVRFPQIERARIRCSWAPCPGLFGAPPTQATFPKAEPSTPCFVGASAAGRRAITTDCGGVKLSGIHAPAERVAVLGLGPFLDSYGLRRFLILVCTKFLA